MSESKTTIGFRANNAIMNIVRSLKSTLGVDSDSDVIRVAIEDLADRQEAILLTAEPIESVERLVVKNNLDTSLSKDEIEFVFSLAYQAIYLGIDAPKHRQSFVLVLNALKDIYSLLPESEQAGVGYHRDKLSCCASENIVECIDRVILNLPKTTFISSGNDEFVKPVANLQGILQEIDNQALNNAIKPYLQNIIMMAKRTFFLRDKHSKRFLAEETSGSIMANSSENHFSISAIRDNGGAQFMVSGFANDVDISFDFLKLDALWRNLKFSVETKRSHGNVMLFKQDSIFTCRIYPCPGCGINILLDENKVIDLSRLLSKIMATNGSNPKMDEIILLERSAYGFV